MPFLLTILLSVLGFAGESFAHEKSSEASGVEGLDVYDQGNVVDLLLSERKGHDHWLSHQRSTDGGTTWTKPVKVDVAGGTKIGSLSRGSDAQVAAAGERVVALWTAPGSTKWGTGPLATAYSDDAGKTWKAGPSPTDVAAPDGQSYVDLAADGTGTFHAVWLDGRDGGQGLRYASSGDPAKSWSKNETLVKRTCECCWNKILATPKNDIMILYRGKDPRDMALYKRPAAGAWQPAGVVGDFKWKFDGCPHVGGALASSVSASGEETHALVWTGASGKVGLHYLRSDDQKTWSKPVRLGDAAARHADLAAKGSAAAAVWDALLKGKRVIYGSTTSDSGKTWSTPNVISDAAQSSSHPRLVPTPTGFLAFWTERGKNQVVAWRQSTLTVGSAP